MTLVSTVTLDQFHTLLPTIHFSTKDATHKLALHMYAIAQIHLALRDLLLATALLTYSFLPWWVAQ